MQRKAGQGQFFSFKMENKQRCLPSAQVDPSISGSLGRPLGHLLYWRGKGAQERGKQSTPHSLSLSTTWIILELLAKAGRRLLIKDWEAPS